MKFIDDVIKQIKDNRKGIWIYDESGVIRGDIFVGETIDLLEHWKEYEIDLPEDLTEDELYDIIEYNTYNWGANISNDIAFGFDKERKIMIAHVHLCGDIRYNYSYLFALDIENLEELLDINSNCLLLKDIDDIHMAFFNMFDEGMEVFNSEKEDSIKCFELEKADLLKEIAEKESE